MQRSITTGALILLFISSILSAQNITVVPQQPVPLGATNIATELPLAASPRMRNTHVVPEPGTHLDKVANQQIMDRITAEKRAAIADGSYDTQSQSSRAVLDAPTLIRGYRAELSQGFPNDNEGACSPAGFFINTTNTAIKIYDPSGNQLINTSLVGFTSGLSTISNFRYDPRALFDPINGRFIVMMLSGSRPSNSEILVSFSQTNDPSGAWNHYAIRGNLQPGGVEVWSDYPIIGISKSDLVITSNMFDASDSFEAIGVYHMDLADGYSGSPLTNTSYIIGGNVFTVTPCSDQSDQPSDQFYLITKSGRPSGNSFIIYEIDDALKNGGTLQNGQTINGTRTYNFAPPAVQKNSNQLLSPGDSRMHTAYRRGNNLYFVFNTSDNNRASMYVGSIKLSQLGINFSRLSSEIISSDSIEYAFPSICYGGTTVGDDHSSFIFFNYSGQDFFPGTGVMYIDESGQLSQPLLISESRVPSGTSSTERRWGDYTDVSYQASGVAFGAGYHFEQIGNNTREATWVSQFIAPAPLNVSNDRPIAQAQPLTVAPNPVVAYTKFTFEVPTLGVYSATILDMNGKVVESLLEEKLSKGEASIGFYTGHLPNGNYMVRIQGDNSELFTGRFSVNR